jgi:hypothetical protein
LDKNRLTVFPLFSLQTYCSSAFTRIPTDFCPSIRRIGYIEADLLTSYPTLSATNLANAWAYAAAFPDEIEAEIAENNAVMEREI